MMHEYSFSQREQRLIARSPESAPDARSSRESMASEESRMHSALETAEARVNQAPKGNAAADTLRAIVEDGRQESRNLSERLALNAARDEAQRARLDMMINQFERTER